ncbi:hypothetical protein MMC29_000773 [Sticta canariensis]|nr:hypothetical protein [Sticta canariensis]
MCYFDETLYLCGCPMQCEFFPCKECVKASENEGGYVCPKLGKENKITMLETLCDYNNCEAHQKGLTVKALQMFKAFQEREEVRKIFRNGLEMAREKSRTERKKTLRHDVEMAREKSRTEREEREKEPNEQMVDDQAEEDMRNAIKTAVVIVQDEGKEKQELENEMGTNQLRNREKLHQLILEILEENREDEGEIRNEAKKTVTKFKDKSNGKQNREIEIDTDQLNEEELNRLRNKEKLHQLSSEILEENSEVRSEEEMPSKDNAIANKFKLLKSNRERKPSIVKWL